MLKRLFTTILAVVAIAGFAQVATAQYMYLDSNANGIHDPGDNLNATGVPTTVDVWINTNHNRDGSEVECNTADGILRINSYVVNLKTSGVGTVTYGGFINQQAPWTVNFGEVNAGDGQYKNGRGGPVDNALAPGGPYKLMTITITATSGSPSIIINDLNSNSADFTSFGTQCSGNDFDNTYKLTGPGGGSDWTDVDGLGPPPGAVNTAPELAAIGAKTVAEGSLLGFTATATDTDVPAQALTFTLGAGAPAGAVITSGGAFTWTPTEAQGPGTFPITVIVTDNGTPNLNDTETIQVTVTEVNNFAPVMAAIGNRTVNELALLSFTATATDADVPPNGVSFSLGAGNPVGSQITTGGNFTWTPTEAQGPGVFPITVNVADNGSPSLTDTETIQVTVNEVNVAPILNPIGNKTTATGVAVTFTATATDADLPANTLAFSLGAGAPAGATIGATTGNFSWTPTSTVGSPFPVTVIVTDNGTPALSDNELIQITVTQSNLPPVLGTIGNRTVNESSLLSFTATATDPNAGDTFTFSLEAGAPAGAAITTGGAFTWTPTEAQGPNVFPITVRVTDAGGLFDNETIQVTVNEVNSPPVLAAIGNRTVNEGVNLAFTATATDPDVPPQSLTFSLGAGAPAGAAITPGGNFSWTPTEAQGPGSFPITVIVTDAGAPPLNDTETITVTVNEVNLPPVLAAIGNRTVNEGVQLAFTATATDPDLPANALTFTLGAGAPAGAVISAGGAFTWTPTEAQGPGSFPITVVVTDNGTPALNDSEAITVTVNEVNVAPILGAIGNRTVNEGVQLAFTATATDADVPGQTLTFTLGAGAPAGAAISNGGSFTWTPTEAQGPGAFPITVIVTDNGTPLLNDSETITVTVNEVERRAGSRGDRQPDGERACAPLLHGDRDGSRCSAPDADLLARRRRSCRCGDHGGRQLHLHPVRNAGRQHVPGHGHRDGQRHAGSERHRDDPGPGERGRTPLRC